MFSVCQEEVVWATVSGETWLGGDCRCPSSCLSGVCLVPMPGADILAGFPSWGQSCTNHFHKQSEQPNSLNALKPSVESSLHLHSFCRMCSWFLVWLKPWRGEQQYSHYLQAIQKCSENQRSFVPDFFNTCYKDLCLNAALQCWLLFIPI